nr:hypothetical protein [Tanacetum cinerariifolium]
FSSWNTVVVKQTNDITRLQALVDKKKVVITKATIRDALHLGNAEGVDCLPNEEIFAELARMGYKKPSTKLTFYKAFFSSQWKFLIHTILQSLSAKRTPWNEFSSAMASTVICLSIGRKFNFSKYIFKSLVRNIDSSSKFYMYPRFIQLIIQNQLGDLSTHTTKYTSPALTQKVFANIRRVGKGFSGVETHLFEGMLVAGVSEEEGDVVQDQSIPSLTPLTPPPQQPQDLPLTSQAQHTPPQSPQPQPQSQSQAHQQATNYPMMAQALEITKLKRKVKKLEKANKVRVLKLKRLKKVETSQRINSSDDTVMEDASNQERMIDALDSDAVTAASTTIAVAEPQVPAAIITVVPKKQQVEMDEEYVRKLHEELNKDIDWNDAIDHVKKKAKEDPFVQLNQVIKKRPQTEAQARRNVIMYLKNVVGFRLDYFKGMSYDDIRP